MKKQTILYIAVFLLQPFTAFADNSARIKELAQEFQQKADQKQSFISEAQKCEVRMIEIQGIVKELSPAPEPEKKK